MTPPVPAPPGSARRWLAERVPAAVPVSLPRWVAVPLAVGVVSRLFSLVLLWIAYGLGPGKANIPHFLPVSRLDPFIDWDGQWYLSIAARGYHADPLRVVDTITQRDTAFFPLWPALIRLVSLGGLLDERIVAIVLANALAVVAIVVIWRVLEGPFGEATATSAIVLLAFSPVAFVLSMAYTEPLSLLLAGLAFLAWRRPITEGAIGVLAMLTRVSAVALAAPAAVRFMRGPHRSGAFALAAGLGVALLAWIATVAAISHDPLGFFHYGAITWGKDSGLHFVVQQLLHGSVAAKLRFAAWAVALVGAVLAARRDLELGAYALAATLLALLPGSVVASMPRYALVAFPAFAGLASLGGRRWTAVLLVAFVALEIVFALETFGVDKLYAP